MLVLIIFGIFGIGILAENSGNFPSEVCNLKAKTGPCRALDPRYYYNSQEKACQKFNYGGCAGNKNNFKTEEECINFCIKSVTPSSSDIRYQIPAPSFIQKTTTPSVPETLQKPSDTIANKPGDTTNSKPNDTNSKPIDTNYKPIDTNSKPNDTIDSQPKDTTDSEPNETIYIQPKDTLPKPNETNSKP